MKTVGSLRPHPCIEWRSDYGLPGHWGNLSMAKTANPKTSGAGDTLQQAVEDGLANIPLAFLEHQISKKLKSQIARPPKGLARKIAEHLLSGNAEPFVLGHAARRGNIKLTIDESDVEQITRAVEHFPRRE